MANEPDLCSTHCDLWHNIDKLQKEIIIYERIHALSNENKEQVAISVKAESSLRYRNDVLRKLEDNIERIIESLQQNKAPAVAFDSRTSWQNVSFSADVGLKLDKDKSVSELRFDSINSTTRFALMLSLMSECYKLVQSNTFSTKRDIYYRDPQLFGSQSVVDELADNIACMLSVPRHHLHLLATSKGCLAGDLSFIEMDGNCVDCSTTTTGILVPSHVEGLTNIRSEAKFVLIVEKDATFQKLLDDGLLKRIKSCIIITGKGFPDINTRMMVRKLWDCFHIPIFGLVDADPHGIEILCVYKFGSKSYSFDSHNLTVPSIRWLGVLPSDIKHLQIRKESLIPLTKADMDKAGELIKRPYYKQIPKWMKEIQILLTSGYKAEIQTLTAISNNFMTDVYIPNKIQHGGWI
ncbi:meiotic recombination protein SPO11-like [Antedon mediterranea]|uniref:meiotic recombination protein SPO11-like n=1 Tax=Antedon mediterranea TaxID=105859 RepID=UPI003AF4E55A